VEGEKHTVGAGCASLNLADSGGPFSPSRPAQGACRRSERQLAPRFRQFGSASLQLDPPAFSRRRSLTSSIRCGAVVLVRPEISDVGVDSGQVFGFWPPSCVPGPLQPTGPPPRVSPLTLPVPLTWAMKPFFPALTLRRASG
jgi:hypothetical protein